MTLDFPELLRPGGALARAGPKLLVRWLQAGARLRRALPGADIVVLNGVHALPPAAFSQLFKRRPAVVLVVHDIIQRSDRALLVRLLRWCASGGAITVSAAAADALAALGLRAEVVHNGTEWPVAPALPRTGTPVVGCMAALTPGKGQDVLLSAARSLPGVDFELAGAPLPKDRQYAARLRAMAGDPALAGRVRMLGHVERPLEHIRSWSVAVLPSTVPEGAGLSVLEAMSVGVPVVAADHGGVPEYLGDAGLLVEPGDSGALAGAIAKLLADPALHRACARAGRHRVQDRFRLDRQVERFLDALADIADRTPR